MRLLAVCSIEFVNCRAKNQLLLRARDGGLVDLDLLIQAMRLEHGNLFDDTGQSPLDILDRLVAAKKITSPNFTELQDAISLFNEVHQCIRLTFGDATQVNHLPQGC